MTLIAVQAEACWTTANTCAGQGDSTPGTLRNSHIMCASRKVIYPRTCESRQAERKTWWILCFRMNPAGEWGGSIAKKKKKKEVTPVSVSPLVILACSNKMWINERWCGKDELTMCFQPSGQLNQRDPVEASGRVLVGSREASLHPCPSP